MKQEKNEREGMTAYTKYFKMESYRVPVKGGPF